jgi:hypothetical protein
MNMYLHDCVQSQRKPIFKWAWKLVIPI